MAEDLKEKIVEFLKKKGQAKNREIAKALGAPKSDVDQAIRELTREGVAEYKSFGGVTYVALKEGSD